MKTLLVIDDEASVRDAFVLALHDSGVRVEGVANGEAGIAAARERRPDLVMLDLRMPGIDGVTTLRRLLADDPTLRISILTAFHAEYMTPLRVAAAEGLRFDLVHKPLDGEQIRAIVEGWLGCGDARRPHPEPPERREQL